MQKTDQESFFSQSGANVYSIEPSQNFLGELAQGLNNELYSEDGLKYADAIILLPTRRAARALGQEFLNCRKEKATILPRIRTLGDIDPEDLGLGELGFLTNELVAISPMLRQLILAGLIQKRNLSANWNKNPVAAINAADALADLLESGELNTIGEGRADWSKLDNLVIDKELAKHWELSTEFLQIITKSWPEFLDNLGLCDPAYKRRLAIEKLASHWQNNPPSQHIIIAGSTGAIPATRNLMKVVANLPKGAVILPGLDKNMASFAWRQISKEVSHPQRILHDTINYIGIDRADVKNWGANPQDKALIVRRELLNHALTPKEITAHWLVDIEKIKSQYGQQAIEESLKDLSIIEAKSEDEEAKAIAIEMRLSLEGENQSCALITPNLDIARRVSAKMRAWGVVLDISSGLPVFETKLGTFINQSINWINDFANYKNIASIMAHPFANFGLEWQEKKNGASNLEIGVLHSSQKDRNLESLLKRTECLNEEKSLKYSRINKNYALIMANALLNISNKIIEKRQNIKTLKDCAEFLIISCEIIATDANGKNGFIWQGEAGQALSNFFGQILIDGQNFEIENVESGFEILKALISKIVVRPLNAHPQLAILGPLEARLLNFDKLILAGLDEGIWPAAPDTDPFLSRPMRDALGLEAKDMRIGLSAHDFAQLAMNKKIIVTRSNRRGGSPAVPSRWLWRLRTLCAGALGEKLAQSSLNSGTQSIEFARNILPMRDFDPVMAQPRPKPPIEARPNKFSATQLETWVRDPYKTYVQKILDIKPLDEIGGEVTARERGTIIHKALESTQNWQINWPQNPYDALMHAFESNLTDIGLCDIMLRDELERLKPTAELIVSRETILRQENVTSHCEAFIEWSLNTEFGTLEIKATADKLEIDKNNNCEIWDYKTGTPPTDKMVNIGFAPQLPITALLLHEGAYKDLKLNKIKAFGHIKIGNKKPEIKQWEGKWGRNSDKKDPMQIDELLEKSKEDLIKMYEIYMDEATPYLSKPKVQQLPKQNYQDQTDLLARRHEWASIDDENEGDE